MLYASARESQARVRFASSKTLIKEGERIDLMHDREVVETVDGGSAGRLIPTPIP